MLKDCVFPHPFPKRPSVAGVSLGWERAGNPSAEEPSVIPAPAAVRVAKINWRGEQNGAIFLIFHQGALVAGQWGLSGWERARGCPWSKAGLAAAGHPGAPRESITGRPRSQSPARAVFPPFCPPPESPGKKPRSRQLRAPSPVRLCPERGSAVNGQPGAKPRDPSIKRRCLSSCRFFLSF